MDIFRPKINKNHKYGVAIPLVSGNFSLLQTYPDMDELKSGYRSWYNFAWKRGVTKPLPVEKTEDDWSKCSLMKEVINISFS
jgi:hypothetical protein